MCFSSSRKKSIHTPPRIISTPALEALRTRNSREKKSTTRGAKPRKSAIRPSSQADFLRRLETFKLSSYPAGKPRPLSPPSMAAYGWTNADKNRLKCLNCHASWVLATPSNGDWASSSGLQLGTLGIRMRTDQHRPACPWRTRHCPPIVYAPPRSKTSQETFETLIKTATEISDALFPNGITPFQVQHTLSEQAVTTLSIALQSSSNSSTRNCPTTAALILALCGWSVKLIQAGRRESSDHMSQQGSASLPEASLYCKLCHRQALPSSKSPTNKTFDPIHQHREYCPFIDPHAGFDEPLLPVSAGWQAHLQAIQNVVDRQNFSICPSKPTSIPNQPYVTLENIASHFYPPPIASSLSPLSSSSSHINLVNFVKQVLSGPPEKPAGES
ncbi:uncharacterized protein VP01_50g7 [Puccinia sorghi]|uniref:C3HC-type domain-containing protein n=1 Tax=Puccinia sorghi TaxID=27349 RepID=A0A0L6UL97_9BASI|nr:uncharacterized protein VP01_50g7 [Puccinia sorghi]